MTCKELAERVMAYREGELSFTVRLSLQFHAALCPCCRSLLRSYDTTVALSGEIADLEVPEEVARDFDGMIQAAMATAPPEPDA